MQNRKQITLDGECISIANVGEVTTASLASAPPVRCHHCWSVIAKNRWMRCFIRSEPEKKKGKLSPGDWTPFPWLTLRLLKCWRTLPNCCTRVVWALKLTLSEPAALSQIRSFSCFFRLKHTVCSQGKYGGLLPPLKVPTETFQKHTDLGLWPWVYFNTTGMFWI